MQIILARKEEVMRLEEEGEEGMIHSLLSSLPALIDGDDNNEDEELENQDQNESGNDDFVLPTRRLFGEEGDARLSKAESSPDGKTNGISTPRKRYELRRFGRSDEEMQDGEMKASTDKVKEEEITGDQSDAAGRPLASPYSPSTSPTLTPSTTETLLSTPILSTPALSFSTSPTLPSSSPPPGLTLDLLDEDPSMSDGKADDGQPSCPEEAGAFDEKIIQLIRPASDSGEATPLVSGTGETKRLASESGEASLLTSETKQAAISTTGTAQATSSSSESGEAMVPPSGTGEAITSTSGNWTASKSEETTRPVLEIGQAMASAAGVRETTPLTSGIGETLMHENNTNNTENDAENTDYSRRKQLETEISTLPIYHPSESENSSFSPFSSNLRGPDDIARSSFEEETESHVELFPTLPPKKRHAFKPKLSLPLLLSQADALAVCFPPSDAGLHLSSIMGPQSVVYTFSVSHSALPSDDEAEAMVRNPGLVVYPQMPFGVEEEEESAESEGEWEKGGRKGEKGKSREKGRGRRPKIKERLGEKKRWPAGRPQTTTVVAGAVVVLGVAMAVYGMRRGGGVGAGEEGWRGAAEWVVNRFT